MNNPASFATRWLCCFIAWLALGKAGAADLVVGAAVASVAASLSLRLVPPARRPLHPVGAARFAGRFAVRSVLASVDVAIRAFHPRLPLKPGLVAVPTRLPEGFARQAFCAFASLQPGTLPVEQSANGIVLSCLDVDAPVAADLYEDETLFLAMIGAERSNG